MSRLGIFDALQKRWKIKQRYIRFCQFAPGAGRRTAFRLSLWNGRKDISVRPRGVRHQVQIRADSSDIDVFMQIFAAQEYACLLGLKHVDLIIDAGANVGFSSVYFLSRFPSCRVIAVEPDAANYKALQRNLAPYADRVKLYNFGVWSKSVDLMIEARGYRDGRDWTRQVRECAAGEHPHIQAITIDDLIENSGVSKLSLLKMDIEGAEAVVFADPSCQQWLPKTEAIAIELHDDSGFGPASDLFNAAIQDQHYQISHSGELTICLRADQTAGR
jgi:FkbM family methyltransferase